MSENLVEKIATNQVLSILVVDDDELNQRMMKILLKKEGHTVECVSNGLEAFNAVKAKPYDIILMDLQMPVMDGVDASRHIRAWESGERHTFIVALTASFLPEKGRELFEAGIDNYIAKPFDVDHLRNILQFSIEKRKTGEASKAEKSDAGGTLSGAAFDARVGIQRVGGDVETYKELLGDFVHELPEKMETLRRCYRENDLESLYRAAHNLKGVSANLGALQLSEHARRLEKHVRESYTATVDELLKEISIVLDKFRESASDYISAGE
jgi:CheY-like chemotaxis protein/HPt (histidine-containing phosphotransfer) domain-containing protein